MGRCRGRSACTLLDCEEGDTVRVAMVRGARRNRRLLDLGIFPGEIVQIRRKLPNLSVVVRVKGCDIAISPEIAASVIVESCP
jgi:DtxR family Mn-dependent transcriptional regulator